MRLAWRSLISTPWWRGSSRWALFTGPTSRNLSRRLPGGAKGYIEAATAFGFSGGQTFRRILFPAMMRYAAGIGNNWQVILKATALVSLLGLEDVVKQPSWRVKHLEPFCFPSSVA